MGIMLRFRWDMLLAIRDCDVMTCNYSASCFSIRAGITSAGRKLQVHAYREALPGFVLRPAVQNCLKKDCNRALQSSCSTQVQSLSMAVTGSSLTGRVTVRHAQCTVAISGRLMAQAGSFPISEDGGQVSSTAISACTDFSEQVSRSD